MKYYSLNHISPKVNFKEATIQGQAPDKGLYFPETIPVFDKSFIRDIEKYSNEEIAYRVIQPFVSSVIPERDLQQIVTETVNFNIPLVRVTENISSLELFHGPTLAFKDVGARFMSRCLGYFSKEREGKVTVLVATSGDTGAAVANGFHKVKGVEVVILYPSGKVSLVQEKQLTTYGDNISAIEVKGNFDDCQQLVKTAFTDTYLQQKLFLTSANSINVARWLPQQFYYLFAWKQWKQKDQPPVISVPSGNFGNIAAGMLAHQSGLPVKHFIAACNANATVPDYLTTGNYIAKPAVKTISNAMDVGNPNNFVRILQLLQNSYPKLKEILSAESISDDITRATIKSVYENENYLLDPHGAVAYTCLANYLSQHKQAQGIFLETAHPVKFNDVIEPLIDKQIPLPAPVKNIMHKERNATLIENDYEALKGILLG